MKLTGNWVDPTIYKINNALGDSATTVFNLTDVPISIGNLEVILNGLTRDAIDDYNLASNQVTFTFAPTIGQKIVFRYIKK